MIEKINLNNILFLDIETVPRSPRITMRLDTELKDLWGTLKPNTSVKRIFHLKNSMIGQEFGAEFGKIVCISVGFFANKGDIRKL